MHLLYSLITADLLHVEHRHAQDVMKDLGITYQHATPQTMGDQWWFWNCENLPCNLPRYLTELNLKPMECVGRGLSLENAEMIEHNKVYSHINFCNGEIRLQAVRYDSGWYCLIVLEEQYDDLVFEAWDDLLAGDNDYFKGRDFLQDHQRVIFIQNADTPQEALRQALAKARTVIEVY